MVHWVNAPVYSAPSRTLKPGAAFILLHLLSAIITATLRPKRILYVKSLQGNSGRYRNCCNTWTVRRTFILILLARSGWTGGVTGGLPCWVMPGIARRRCRAWG